MCRVGFGVLIDCVGVWGSGFRGWSDCFGFGRVHFGVGRGGFGIGCGGLGV